MAGQGSDAAAPAMCRFRPRSMLYDRRNAPKGTVTNPPDLISTLRFALPTLREQWPIRSLALFGSRVRDDARPDSDLDVLVKFARPIPLSSFLALEDRLSELTGLKVDLVSAAALKRYIGEHVRADSIPL
ncbi:MAG: nucleotidyltransferase family protein [Acetobacteraceae bacterium]